MGTTITINAKDLNEKAIKAIQERFGDAELEIQVQHSTENVSHLSSDECWALIGRLDWIQEDAGDNLVIAPLLDALSELPIRNIYQFADWLSEMLWNLDTRAHAQVFLEEDEYLSVDDFLYARCAVVANGQDFYQQVLETPADMPTDVTFEALLYVPQEAFQKKTGEKMVYVPLFNYETYSNKEGWGK